MTEATQQQQQIQGRGATKSQTQLNSSSSNQKTVLFISTSACKHTPQYQAYLPLESSLIRPPPIFTISRALQVKGSMNVSLTYCSSPSCSAQAEQRLVDVLVEERGMILTLFSNQVFYSFSHPSYAPDCLELGAWKEQLGGRKANVLRIICLLACFSCGSCCLSSWALGKS